MKPGKSKVLHCKVCQRVTNNAYICRRCGIEIRELLVGGRDPDSQPGIVWYAKRLRETAYGQSRISRSLAARSANQGYALLTDTRAVKLLRRINLSLARWEATVERLRVLWGDEKVLVHTGVAEMALERLETRRARYIAARVVLIRHRCEEADRLHAELLSFARQAWKIINRPFDNCCGPCPTFITEENEIVSRCDTILYAEDGAGKVQCPSCRTEHDVEELRHGLRLHVHDMLFSGPDLMSLMETRLNDRISKSTFYQLIRDGRLQARCEDDDGIALFTYNDVCTARDKPKPDRRSRAS